MPAISAATGESQVHNGHEVASSNSPAAQDDGFGQMGSSSALVAGQTSASESQSGFHDTSHGSQFFSNLVSFKDMMQVRHLEKTTRWTPQRCRHRSITMSVNYQAQTQITLINQRKELITKGRGSKTTDGFT